MFFSFTLVSSWEIRNGSTNWKYTEKITFIVCDTLRICSRLICFVSLLCVFQLMWCCPLVSRSKCPALTSGDIIRCFTDIRHCPGAPPRTRPPPPGRSWLPAPASPARWAPWWPGSPSWASSAWNKNHNQSPNSRVCSLSGGGSPRLSQGEYFLSEDLRSPENVFNLLVPAPALCVGWLL